MHYISDDLGLECLNTPTWLDEADVLLELEIKDRLTAERIMDEIEKNEP